MKINNAQPKIALNYLREAYFLKDDPTTRITFDRKIKYKPTNSHDLNQSCDKSILPNAMTVLEVKFYNKMPEKVSSLIDKFKLEKQPVSKYINSIVDLMFDDKNVVKLNEDAVHNLFNLLINNKRL